MLANRVRMTQQSGLPRGTVFDFPFTGDIQEVELPRGRYKLEVWGAEGGSAIGDSGKGGYSCGNLQANEKLTMYIFVGGKGASNVGSTKTDGGFNGGGTVYGSSSHKGAGGGGTDIRIEEDSLYNRVIVAGGGGGASTGSFAHGGSGGGLEGGLGETDANSRLGGVGTQTQAGSLPSQNYYGNSYNKASFGVGGGSWDSGASGGGGGGGWFGGGQAGGSGAGGSGGSGYIHTPTSHKPSGWLLTEERFLGDAETVGGDNLMPSPTGEEQTGHSGDGYARITVV